jgi:flagellar basal body-associated protein FliL
MGGAKARSASTASVALSKGPVFHEFPTLRVDLKTDKCRSPYIKVTVIAEVFAADEPRLKAKEAAIIDTFQAYLRGRTRAEAQGKAGTELLRGDFHILLNRVLAPARAKNLLFHEIILD